MIQINEFPNYLINSKGQVFSLFSNKYLIPQKNGNGYYHFSLSNNKKVKIITVHRLIAMHFIENIDNKPFINHINGIKTDNRIENLEWCTHRENCNHAYKTGLTKNTIIAVKKSNSKIVLDINTGIFYNSVKEVADLYGYLPNVLRNKLNNKNKHTNNTNFIYV